MAYAALKNVETKEKTDAMESFFFAETLKYLYLLYAPRNTLDLNKSVFNTEAHPLQHVKCNRRRVKELKASVAKGQRSSLVSCLLFQLGPARVESIQILLRSF